MSNELSIRTQAAISKYGREICVRAFEMSKEGNGASTVGFNLDLRTSQADTAINAGREIVEQENAKAEAIRACAPNLYEALNAILVQADGDLSDAAFRKYVREQIALPAVCYAETKIKHAQENQTR